MKRYVGEAANIINKVFSEGQYGNLAFADGNFAPMTVRLAYGVLEQNIKIEYILSQLLAKKPKSYIYSVLKVGVYALTNLDDVPDYAIVSECVETIKQAGKGGASGFVNAVLKKVAKGEYALPEKCDKNYYSVIYSKPQWFIDRLTSERGEKEMLQIISAPSEHGVHCRPNTRFTDVNKLVAKLELKGVKCRKTAEGGFVAPVCEDVAKRFSTGELTYQSPCSMLAVDALEIEKNSRVLDVCSAPGGKAVYASEKCVDGEVIACDVHAHRVELIKKYARRMGAKNVLPVVKDATVFDKTYVGAFDRVLVDAPCSCFGTFLKHPDVLLLKSEGDIDKLKEIQREILKCAAQYLSEGGVLIYSTCTLLKAENEDISEFALSLGLKPYPFMDGSNTKRVLPYGEYEGFFIARYTK